MKEKTKPGVMLYFDTCAVIEQMPMEDAYELLMAIFAYARDGEAPAFRNPALNYAWGFIQPSLRRDDERYYRTVEQRRRAAEKRWAKHRAADDDAADANAWPASL